MAPHSKTVRGTLDNPKTQEAKKISPDNPTQLGDPGSLKVEDKDTEPTPDPTNQDGANAASSSSKSLDPYDSREDSNQPHSKQVRGTLSHPATAGKIYTNEAGEQRPKAGEGKKEGGSLPSSMIGDPVSMKAETSGRDEDRGAGPAKDADELQRAANQRKNNEIRSGSGGGSKL